MTFATRSLIGLLFLTILPTSLVSGSIVGPIENSWGRELVVPGGQSIAVGGALEWNEGGIQISGDFTVRSCCGLSTNDIEFRIRGLSTGQDFGPVVGSLTFQWNSGLDESYQLIFDNTWDICNATLCGPDPSNPSYHNKTIEVDIRESIPGTIAILGVPYEYVVTIGAAAVVSALVGIAILRKMRRKG